MSNARDNIIQRLKSAATTDVAEYSQSADELPGWSEKEKLRRFIERLEAVRAEVVLVARDELAATLTARLVEGEIENLLYDPTSKWGEVIGEARDDAEKFPQLLIYDRSIEKRKKSLFDHIDAAITSTLGGIAETGSLILWPTETEPRSMSLVPPVHIAIVEAEAMFSTFAEAMEKQSWASKMPTNALLVSGPSKSADIERTLAYGVHGPRELIVLIVH